MADLALKKNILITKVEILQYYEKRGYKFFVSVVDFTVESLLDVRISGQLEDGVGESGCRRVETSEQEENRMFPPFKV